MRKRFAALVAGALIVLSLAAAPSASAATEFGDNCVANQLSEGTTSVTLFEISAPGNPLPLTAPTTGVLTKWNVNLVPVPLFIPHTLKVLRPVGGNLVQIVGESSGSITGGPNSFATRIAVAAGDRLALFGTGSEPYDGTLYCDLSETSSETTVIGGFLGGGGTTGATVPFVQEPAEAFRIPVSGVIEADADGDGFGDETQDACPQAASAQAACPAVTVDAASVVKKKGSVVVLVTTTTTAPVKVSGTANLGKGKKAKLSGKTLTVAPGKVTRFTLKFTKKLKKKLKGLSHKKSLQLKLTATATDVIGRVTTDKLKTKLKGQAGK